MNTPLVVPPAYCTACDAQASDGHIHLVNLAGDYSRRHAPGDVCKVRGREGAHIVTHVTQDELVLEPYRPDSN